MVRVPVLEIGGTHVTGAVVEIPGVQSRMPTLARCFRESLPERGTSEEIGRVIARVAGELRSDPTHTWGVAIPGPFDYERGIGEFVGVGKFDALRGVDMRQLLRETAGIDRCVFLNDADAFGLGERYFGAGIGLDPSVYLTLGTGVGSSFIRDGKCIKTGVEVPPEGYLYRAEIDDEPLEQRFSRRAIRSAWHAATGTDLDVAEIASLALEQHPVAAAVFRRAYADLATALAPYLRRFDATAVIIGGSIAKSWNLMTQWFTPALLGEQIDAKVLPATRDEHAGLWGVAAYAQGVGGPDTWHPVR